MFHSKEAEEQAKKVPAKTFTPGELANSQDTTKGAHAPKVVGPTPEQITAIKVPALSPISIPWRSCMNASDQNFLCKFYMIVLAV
jgi:hypothetical protein